MNKKLFSVAVMIMFLASYGTAAAQNRNSQATALSTHTSESTTTNTGIACTDSDDGSNYFVKGSVQDANRPGLFRTYDKCVSDSKLLEYSCKNGSWYASYFECPFGCSNGACLKQNQTAPDTVQITENEINNFIEDFVENTSVDDIDLSEINENVESKGMTDEEIRNYLEDYLMTIDFDNETIKDEEDLQDFLVDYFAGLKKDSNAVNLPDGSLIKLPDDPKVYVVKDGTKEWIETAEEFVQEGYDWNAIQEVDEDTLKNIQDQIRLIKDELNRVYEVIGDMAMWVPNEEAFAAEGLNWNDVEDVNGNVEDTYEVVNIVADKDGNLYYITENGKKQLIMNQDSLESVTGFEDTSAVETSLEEIMSDYMEKILAAVEKMSSGQSSNPNEVIDLSTQMGDKLAQVMDELVSRITSNINAAIGSGNTASAGLNKTDWDAVLEDIIAQFDEESLGDMTDEDIENGMQSVWQQFKAEYSNGSYSATTTTTSGVGTGETWEEAWQNLLDNLKTETTTTSGNSDDEIASELEDAWGDFFGSLGSGEEADMSEWEDFLGDYEYSSDLEDLMSQFENSEDYSDLDSLLSENEDLLDASGIADSLADSGMDSEDLSSIFDMMSKLTGEDFSGLSSLISALSDDSTDDDLESIMGFMSDLSGEDFSGLSSLISGLEGMDDSEMEDISSLFGGMSGSDMSGLSDLMSGLSGTNSSDLNNISSLFGGMSGSDMSGLSDLMSSLNGSSSSDMMNLSNMFSQMGSGSGNVGINNIMSTISGLNGSSGDISSIMNMVSGLTGQDFSGLSSLISGLSGMSGSSGAGSSSGLSNISNLFGNLSGMGNTGSSGLSSLFGGLSGMSGSSGAGSSSGLSNISNLFGNLSGMGNTGSSGLSSLFGGLSGMSGSGMDDISSLFGGLSGMGNTGSSGLSSLFGGLSGMSGSGMSGLSSMMSGLDGSDMSDLSSLMGDFSGMGNLGSMLGSMSFTKSDKFLKSIDDANLIREEGDYKVYDISNGYRTWIPTAEEFNAKGYSWNDIVVVKPQVLEAYRASK